MTETGPRSHGRHLLLLGVALLAACSDSDLPDDETQPARAHPVSRIVPASEALAGAHIPSVDPALMHYAEIEKALGGLSYCTFKYTSAGEPVLAVDRSETAPSGAGVVKLNGNLVMLDQHSRESAGQTNVLELRADPVRITVEPDPTAMPRNGGDLENQESTVTFEIGEDLRTGYRGYLSCDSVDQG